MAGLSPVQIIAQMKRGDKDQAFPADDLTGKTKREWRANQRTPEFVPAARHDCHAVADQSTDDWTSSLRLRFSSRQSRPRSRSGYGPRARCAARSVGLMIGNQIAGEILHIRM
ncbi:hypothetical protein VMCG_06079 [Cytospora schulzeri]|uniref:Uncharacterized protein n=1 Tax=Cytospora schulzeri TaxID=448051 RepID=A0A423WG50_9PEZI|nr:hypothetical protein VMCG_06079 [Valsa malicola]